MEKLKSWALSNGLLTESAVILGIARDNPETTLPENCRYDTCIVVSQKFNIADTFIKETQLTGGTYAVFTIAHTTDAIQTAWTEIFPILSGQGYNIDITRPILERYIPTMINRHLCEICVPV